MNGNLKKRTLFGYTNFRYHVSDPHGRVTWFLTRKARDTRREKLIAEAREAGLSDPEGAFTCVKHHVRVDASPARHAALAWLISRIEIAGVENGFTKSLKEE